MKTKIQLLLPFIFGAIFLVSCQKETKKAEILIISTHNVEIDGTTENGVVFSASILLNSDETILDQGFVYALRKLPSIADNKVSGMDDHGAKNFNIKLDDVLMPDATYYVRSFVQTEKYLIYGNEVSFFSNGSEPPFIEKIEPETAIWGDTIMITGKNFDPSGKENSIWFNQLKATQRWGTTDTIYVVVPDELIDKKSNVSVSLYGKKSESSKTFEIPKPVVHSVSKTEGQYPDTLIVQGKYFSEIYGSLLFGGSILKTASISKSEIRFIIPFLGEGQTVSVQFQQLDEKIEIENEFKYIEQKITGLSKDSTFIGDTLTIYALNIDFQKVDLKTRINNGECSKGLLWKDSMQIITKNMGFFKREFFLECILYDENISQSKILYQTMVKHINPTIKSVETSKLAYLGELILEVSGLYNYYETDFIFYNENDEEIVVTTGYLLEGNRYNIKSLSKKLVPGHYKVKIKLSSRLSNSAMFEVMIPEVRQFGENINYKRGDEIFIDGEYLPPIIDAYQLKQVSGGRVFRRGYKSDKEVENINYYPTNKLIGRVEYQLEFVFNDKIFKTGYSIFLDDYFEFVTEYEWNSNYNYSTYDSKSNVCFSKDGKLYSMLYNESRIEILDLKTKSFIRKSTNLNINDDLIYPTIVNENVYVCANEKLHRYNFATDKWILLEVNHTNDTIINTCVINDELVVQNSSNDILRYNGSWQELGKGDLGNFAHGIGSFCYTYFEGEIQKKSLDDFSIISQTPSPLKPLWNKYRTQNFVYNGEIFETDIYYSTLLITKFSPKDNTFEKLKPEFITDQGATITRFFSDINGEVYFKTDTRHIYKFSPQ